MDHQTCHTLLASLSEFVDGGLEEELCAEIQRHLDDCQNCQIVVDSLRKTIYLVHQSAEGEPFVPQDVRERLYLKLELDDLLKR